MVFALALRMTHQQLLFNLDAATFGEAAIVAMDYEASYTIAHRHQQSIARPIYRTHVLQQQRVFILRATLGDMVSDRTIQQKRETPRYRMV